MALVLSIIHVLACILIVGVILLQSGKGGGMGAGFGGASAAATQLFGGRGAGNFLSRSTVGLATIFMLTSLGLAYLSSRPNSLLDLSETSGREAADEDTIIEEGQGELVELEEGSAPAATATPDGTTTTKPLNLDLKKILGEQMGGTNGAPIEIQLDPSELGLETEPSEEPAVEQVKEPEPEPKADKPEVKAPKPQPKPEPAAKPQPKPEPKPEPEAAPKPEAQPEPEAEEAPAPKSEGSAE